MNWANVSWVPSNGDGSAANPYIVDGAVFGSGQLTWPQWNYIMGYAYGGGGQANNPDPYPTYLPIAVIFEWRNGAKLLYSWKIDGNKPQTPIVLNSAGPIRLQVTQTYDDATKATSISLIFYELHLGDVPYDFGGYYPELTLNVGDHYADGTVLEVGGPSANTRTATVNGGTVTIGLNAGGEYTLTAATTQQTPGPGTSDSKSEGNGDKGKEAENGKVSTEISDKQKAAVKMAVSKLAVSAANGSGAVISAVGDPVAVPASGNELAVTTVSLPYTIGASIITTMAVLNDDDSSLTPVPTRVNKKGDVTVLISGDVTLVPLSVQANFIDTDFGSAYIKTTQEIKRAASLLIVEGIGGGKFAPNQPVTTQQAVTMFLRAIGIPVDYTTAMKTGAKRGLIGSDAAASAVMTRIETAKLIANALRAIGIDVSLAQSEIDSLLGVFNDISGLTATERENLAICVNLGIFQGAGNEVMNPKGMLLRSQMASLAVRLQDVILR